MLNINQNFDLKAPVFNFDRDYFNSVEELNAYDTNNVPDHFVTNVAGMLYLFTNGKWLPMIGTVMEDPDDPYSRIYHVNLSDDKCYIYKDPDDSNYMFNIEGKGSNASMDSDGIISLYVDNSATDVPYIDITKEFDDRYKNIRLGITENESFGLTLEETANKGIQILTDKELTLEEQDDEYSPVDLSLTDGDNSVRINANLGFIFKGKGEDMSNLSRYSLYMHNANHSSYIGSKYILMSVNNRSVIGLTTLNDECSITLGPGYKPKFKISRPVDDTEGATITGVKSIVAFSDLSNTKVFATDGSIADLSTKADTSALDAKANASDVLLKKSATGGYYIEENSNPLGEKAFAANYSCNPTGVRSHAEGGSTDAIGAYSHAEGGGTDAIGAYSHAEGGGTLAVGSYSHAQGAYNIYNINAIHSIGIGTPHIRKNSEFVYFKYDVDPKNGYKYLIGVGGYDGISTDTTTYKSVQEVIADLTARIEQLEKLTANCVSISNVDEQTN